MRVPITAFGLADRALANWQEAMKVMPENSGRIYLSDGQGPSWKCGPDCTDDGHDTQVVDAEVCGDGKLQRRALQI